MHWFSLPLATLLGILSSGLAAHDISCPQDFPRTLAYSFIELGAADTDLEFKQIEREKDARAYHGRLSYQIDALLFAELAYERSTYVGDVKEDYYRAGLGARHALGDATDLYGVGSLVYAKSSAPEIIPDAGIATSLGLRHRLGSRIELESRLILTRLNDDLYKGIDASARLYVYEKTSVALRYSLSKEDNLNRTGYFLLLRQQF